MGLSKVQRLIVDAHEDISYNSVVFGRDFLASVHDKRAREKPPNPQAGTATIGLPELLQANVRVVSASIWPVPCDYPDLKAIPCYTTKEEAYVQAKEQLAYYYTLSKDPRIRLITAREDVSRAVNSDGGSLGLLLSIEGGDSIPTPQHVQGWWASGVRIIGPSHRRTQYAGGTGQPGPLTQAGRELLSEMARMSMILDVSHMSEESFFQALDQFQGPVLASHSNCRAYVPTDRQLSDEMIQVLVKRGGVIGVVLYNNFLLADWKKNHRPKSDVTLATVVKHIQHICDVAGDTMHVGLGSDLDGGLGMESIPLEMDSAADLPKIADALAEAHFTEKEIDNIMAGNWLRFLEESLQPATVRRVTVH
jgi:membrane dipeptidase